MPTIMSGRPARMFLVILALLGAVVLGKCGTSGTYQGGNDSQPYYR